MTSVPVSLAIKLEEYFRGSICYFEEPPHPRAKKPDLIFVLHTGSASDMKVDFYLRDAIEPSEDKFDEIHNFLANISIRQEPPRSGLPSKIVRFLPGEKMTTSSTLEGYSGFGLCLHQPLLRNAA